MERTIIRANCIIWWANSKILPNHSIKLYCIIMISCNIRAK